MDLRPTAVTAALVGVQSRLQIFGLQRWINDYPEEPLLAVLPGVALQEPWQIVGVAETALVGVSAMVVVTALLGMMALIFASLNERRREMAIWRAMGARPATILGLLVLEAALMAVAGRGNADTVTDLSWKDLLPVGDPSLPADLQGILPHDEAGMAARQPLSSGIRTDWNGQAVRLSGFIVPIDYKGTGVTAFILVPYVEACVHVPPPPANQLVFVTAENPLRKRWPVRSCDRYRNVRHGIGIDPIGRNWVCAICGRPRILSKITTGTARAVSPRYVLIQGGMHRWSVWPYRTRPGRCRSGKWSGSGQPAIRLRILPIA